MIAMETYAALDVSPEKTSVCILDRDGRTVLEAVVAREPEALAAGLAPYRRQGRPALGVARARLAGRGLAAALIETRQVRAALSAMTARRIAATPAAWRICSGWDGSARSTSRPSRPASSAPC